MTAVISVETLRKDSSLVVLDARPVEDYLAEHWPGAFHLPISRWEALAKTADGALQNFEPWEREIGSLGIGSDSRVVVYDDGRMTEAARAWFILQWFGVDAVVLDGGWKHLQSLTKVEEQANHPHARTYRRPEGFVPVVGLVDRTALARRLGSSIQILDARTPAEYRGEDLRKNSRGGHLPNASLLPHADLLGPDGTLKAVPELRELLEGAGIGHTAPVVTHCDGGGRAALAALAAVAAGHRDVSAYYLSFSDWAADGSCPIEHSDQ